MCATLALSRLWRNLNRVPRLNNILSLQKKSTVLTVLFYMKLLVMGKQPPLEHYRHYNRD